MAQSAIFGPFIATMLLTLAVWVFMYVRRIGFINANQIRPEDISTPADLARVMPPEVSSSSDNLKNLFELPVLFYALALYLFVTNQVDSGHVIAAWVFVLFRTLHSAVHCTVNAIMLRFYLYPIASLALWVMLLRAAFAHFVG